MKRFVILLTILLLGVTDSTLAAHCAARFDSLVTTGGIDDVEKARPVFELCRAEAEAGDQEAKLYLAYFYFPPHVVVKTDPKEGIKLIREAADNGLVAAQAWLGWQLSEGNSFVPKDEKEALYWLEKAAQANNGVALAFLAAAYEEGRLGLPVDTKKAKELREQASRCAKPAN